MLDELEPVADEPTGPRIPLKLRIAGVIWIGFGGLLVLMHGLQLLMGLAQGAAGEGKNVAGNICAGVLWTLVGGVFVLVGIQSLLGKAKGTLGNGIGSIIFGLFPMTALYFGIKSGNFLLLLVGVLSFLAGLGLLVAGILAILAKDEYRDYRRAVRPAHKRVRTRRVE